ncbi:LacI family DNA-binding transcriptional regulator [Paenibacillus sp. GCM10023252]|uniref:LacI family DNA-binding transcriptional regulator n=1 Tax=Paenibacillus sp. GCM10023252 TaxID=3252649 RepID=UPI00361D4B87
MSKITINDIAKAAQVAKSTVSKVMSDAPSISEETKRKVRAVMKEMNYTPSSLATRLARQTSYNIGVLVDMTRREQYVDPFFYSIVGGIQSVIGPLHYELTMANGSGDTEEDRLSFVNRLVQSRKVDGLIMNHTLLSDAILAHLHQLRFPIVSIGGMWRPDDVPIVDIDNRLGGELLTKHLAEQGRTKIAWIGGEEQDYIRRSRYEGYLRGLEASGLVPIDSYSKLGSSDEYGGERLMDELLGLEDRPDAVICMNNYTAFGVLKALKRAGVSIPSEISVAAFDNYPLAPYTEPPLTCLEVDTFELGIEAATRLMQVINGSSSESSLGEPLLLPPTLIVRESSVRRHT